MQVQPAVFGHHTLLKKCATIAHNIGPFQWTENRCIFMCYNSTFSCAMMDLPICAITIHATCATPILLLISFEFSYSITLIYKASVQHCYK